MPAPIAEPLQSVPVPSAKKRRIPLWLRILLTAGVIAASFWFVVLPQLGSAGNALRSLQQPPVLVLLLALVLEEASNAAYSGLTARIMGRSRLSYFSALRIDASDLSVNHVVPGGGATASAVRFRLFVRAGIPVSESLSGAAIEITISNLALGLLFGIGLTASLGAIRSGGYFFIGLIVVAVLVIGVAFVGWALDKRLEWCVRIGRRVGGRIRRLGADRVESLLRSMAQRVQQLTHEPKHLAATLALALGNWVLDAASLWVMFVAFGYWPSFGTLIAVYGLGSVLAMLPLTPGGLGLVEGVMVPAFAALGVPAGVALLAVIGWRVLEYWLPIPIGGIAYASLRYSERRVRRAPSTAR
jgi:uncharacterized protein (TIRG00374 family)